VFGNSILRNFDSITQKWDELIDSIVADTKPELGLEECELSAHLYKLLVYEKGGLFLPHRDGEKLDHMVATLVVGLPSVHEGGELIVSHQGEQQEFLFAGASSGYQLSYAAFYADCEHEIRSVRSGYRLCLTYNVALAKTKRKRGVGAPSHGATTVAIGELLDDWRKQDRKMMAVALDHRYTQLGLVADKLKGLDRTRADVLFEAARRTDCVAYLALITMWEWGPAQSRYGDSPFGDGHEPYWSDGDDKSEDEGEPVEAESNYEMDEIFESSLSANHWSDQHGTKVRLGPIYLDEGEVVSKVPFKDWSLSREEYEGYTGNAGMTLERWYHRAAIIIWPREQYFEALCQASTAAAAGGLEKLVTALRQSDRNRRDDQRKDCLSFAKLIIDLWTARYSTEFPEEVDDPDPSMFLELLCELDDVDLVRRFLGDVVSVDGTIKPGESLLALFERHGWARFDPQVAKVIELATPDTIERNVDFLQAMCQKRSKNPARIELCRKLCERAFQALRVFDKQWSGNEWSENERPENTWQERGGDRSKLFTSFVTAMLAVDADKAFSHLIDYALASTDRYDMINTHLPAIFKLRTRLLSNSALNLTIMRWVSACRDELEARTLHPPHKPTDYRRHSKFSCPCKDCRELHAFLVNPAEKQHRFVVAKDRRRHLHRIIDDNGCDLVHVTERRGRPFTLVCTKTTVSYDVACKIHKRDLRYLTRILSLEKKVRAILT